MAYRDTWESVIANSSMLHTVTIASMQAAWDIFQAERDANPTSPRVKLCTEVAKNPTQYAQQFTIACSMSGLTAASADAQFVTTIKAVWDIFAGLA